MQQILDAENYLGRLIDYGVIPAPGARPVRPRGIGAE
jgi:hypothetical protein